MINEVQITNPKVNSGFGLPESVTREQVQAAAMALGLDYTTVISLRIGPSEVYVETLQREPGASLRVTAVIPVVSE